MILVARASSYEDGGVLVGHQDGFSALQSGK